MNFRNQLDTWQTQGYLTAQQNTDIRNAGSTAWDATCQRTYNGTLPLGSLIVERLVNISPVSARFNLDTEEF